MAQVLSRFAQLNCIRLNWIRLNCIRLGCTLLLAVTFCLSGSVDAWARSSGGYSRPGGSFRTPSFSRSVPSFRGGSYRRPSFSGGYRRPAPSRSAPYVAPSSPGDRSFSGSRSGAAFDSYRRQQQPPTPQYSPAPSQRRYDRFSPSAASNWLGNRGWSRPPAYANAGRSFGLWDGLFLWTLLNNLGRPGAGEFFHNNQNDPGYREWRAEADRLAANNADLRSKLDQLDNQLAARTDQPRNPGALPPEIPADVAEATPDRTPALPAQGGSTVTVIIVVLVGAGGLAFLAWRRSQTAGSSAMKSPTTTALGSAAAMLRHKLSGESYRPDKFRVGMTLQLDPTPWVLAGNAIKLPPPTSTGNGQAVVSAVGQVQSGNARLTRLYLSDERTLVQLHLNEAGDPDECRLFGTIDEVTPADPGEWGVWLDPGQGMIGWPQFQTKDGKLYDRAWAPGSEWIAPRAITESIETLSGTRTLQSQAMLYAAATGAAAPAPQTEYILVAAVQDQGQARVEIRAGIDLNPALLQLA